MCQHESLPSLPALLLHPHPEESKRGICYGFGQLEVPDHAFDIEILHAHGVDLVVINNHACGFLNRILPLVGNLFMNAGDLYPGLLPVPGAFGFPAWIPLESRQARGSLS
ncbi:MAG: hypothetical protein PWP25_347 [Sphaerochaeta sp.]|nr:hypothetical protein [Sphaerochaeta sp.]